MAYVEEEKIRIKDGWLYMLSSGKPFLRANQRYFVFSKIETGQLSYLSFEYYTDKAMFRRDDPRKGYLDIMSAQSITIRNGNIGKFGHIIALKFPKKEVYLSASDCEDQFQWCAELRAHRFSDPLLWKSHERRRSASVSDLSGREKYMSRVSIYSCPTFGSRNIQEGFLDYTHYKQSDLKIRKMFLYCKDCIRRKNDIIQDLFTVTDVVFQADEHDNQDAPIYETIGNEDKRPHPPPKVGLSHGKAGTLFNCDYDDAFGPAGLSHFAMSPQIAPNSLDNISTEGHTRQQYTTGKLQGYQTRRKQVSSDLAYVSSYNAVESSPAPVRILPVQDTNSASASTDKVANGTKNSSREPQIVRQKDSTSSWEVDEQGYVILGGYEEGNAPETSDEKEEDPTLNGALSQADHADQGPFPPEKTQNRIAHDTNQEQRVVEHEADSVCIDDVINTPKGKKVSDFHSSLSTCDRVLEDHGAATSRGYIVIKEENGCPMERQTEDGLQRGTQETASLKKSSSTKKTVGSCRHRGKNHIGRRSKDSDEFSNYENIAESTNSSRFILKHKPRDLDDVENTTSKKEREISNLQLEVAEKGSQCNLATCSSRKSRSRLFKGIKKSPAIHV